MPQDSTPTSKAREKIVCPDCKQPTIERISRPTLFKLFLGWTEKRRFKCYNCYKVFYS